MQLNVGVSQAIEIHGLEALGPKGRKRPMSSQPSLLPSAEWILRCGEPERVLGTRKGVWRAGVQPGEGKGVMETHPSQEGSKQGWGLGGRECSPWP